MNRQRLKTCIAALLAAVMTLSLCVTVLPGSAYAVSQAEIDALKNKRNSIIEKRDAQQAVIDELEEQQADVFAQKKALDERNAYTIEQMQLNSEEIDLYGQMIEEKAQELEVALQLEAEQLARYRSRVRAMEERGSYNILALILKANNLGELLTTIDDVGEIMESDRELEDAYIAARENTERVKADYEETKVELEAKQAELEAEQEQLEAELHEAEQLIADLAADITKNYNILAEFQRAEDQADREIEQMIAELEEQRRREEEERRRAEQAAQQQSQPSYGGTATPVSGFGWPVSCTYITSCVGYRYHPISKEYKYHSGMDIGASYGAAVTASAGGTVSHSGEKGGYGECVMINHGNGYYTLYGHLSSRAVVEGQSVSQGQVIGYVGSTGLSTGPHLHFEIRDGSGPLDFSSWFTGLTYAPDSGG